MKKIQEASSLYFAYFANGLYTLERLSEPKEHLGELSPRQFKKFCYEQHERNPNTQILIDDERYYT